MPLASERLAEAGLRLDLDGAVATVTLTNPERRNAQTPLMWSALAEVGRELTGETRVVVLCAEGPSFSAGLDRRVLSGEGVPGFPPISEFAALPAEEIDERIAGFQAGFTWWRRPDLVSIAAVQGHAVGAGFQLALACDMRVVADDVQFAMREPSLGLVPDLGGTQPLVELLGYPRALELCTTGRWVGADEARELGLAEIVVPRADLEAATADLVTAVLAAPRDAVIETKALLLGATRRRPAEQLAAERQAQTRRIRDLAGLGE